MSTFDPTKPVETRDGRKVRIICTDAKCTNGALIALITDKISGHEQCWYFYRNGQWSSAPSPHDLVNVPVKTSNWQNVWQTGSSMTKVFATKEECKAYGEKGKLGYLRRDYIDDVFVGAEFVPL